MEFRVLGPLEVWEGERQLELGGPKRRAVLAFLLLHANEVVATDWLVDQLWGGKPPRDAAGALHTHVSRLRKELGSAVIASQAWGYVLRCDPGALDLERFERLSAAAESLPALERAEKLAEALALWRGPPLEDLAFEPGLAEDIARLDELRLTALENRIDADLEAGSQTGLVGELEALITQHPLRERLRAALILALYRSGRQAEALEVYRETRRVLADQLGSEPSPELRELERAILQQDPSLRAVPVSTAVVAEAGVAPGRRRHIFLAALLALLLAGLGAATAYVLSARTTSAAGESLPTTSITASNYSSTSNPTTGKTDTHSTKPIDTTPTGATSNGPSQKGNTKPQRHGGTRTTPPPNVSFPQLTQTTTSRQIHHKRRPIRISDDFGEPALNTKIWSTANTGSGAGLDLENGKLVFSIAGDATFDPTGNVGSSVTTTCDFPFDFDARIHFTLPQWPAANGAALDLTSGSAVELIQRFTAPSGDGYNALPNGDTVLQFPDTSGWLRLRRSGSVIDADYLHGHRWLEIGSRNFGAAVYLGLGLSTSQGAWQGQSVSAAIDKFTVTAPEVECPGDKPPK